MSAKDPLNIAPQVEEDIELIEWDTLEEFADKLPLAYPSIRHVYDSYNQSKA